MVNFSLIISMTKRGGGVYPCARAERRTLAVDAYFKKGSVKEKKVA